MKSISVVVPTYNRADLIGETLAAIERQVLAPMEVIVVDDGSTDGTPEVMAGVMAGYGGRVRAIRIANSGELVARNTGLRAASGELVAFCDSDDVWEPDHLRTMASLWEDEPGLQAAYANFRVLRDGVVAARSKFDDAPPGLWDKMRGLGEDRGVFEASYVGELLRFQPFFPSAMVVERVSFLDAGGWDERVSRTVGCDFATTLRTASRPPVGVSRRATVQVRKHASNFSGDNERMNLGDAAVLHHVLASNPGMEAMRPQFEASMAARREAALHSAFARRDFAAVRSIYAMLPSGVPGPRTRLKRTIAGLPAPLATAAASVLSR